MDINEELEYLMHDLYQHGYMCGISDDDYFKAYAMAAERIISGKKFSDELVDLCYKSIKQDN